MSKKNKNKKPESISAVTLPWWKRAGAILTIIPIVGIAGLAYDYKTSDADQLRTLVYQPLYADLNKVEFAINTINLDKLPPDEALTELRRTGAINLIPSRLKTRVVNVFREATDTHMSGLEVKEIVIREMSSRIMEIRTEEVDKAWFEKTSRVIRETPTSKKKGISDSVTLGEGITHHSRSQILDHNFVPVAPGGPIFTIRDWLGYPESIKTIEPLWKEIDYLHFHPNLFPWYYKLTREDLKRIDTNLEQLLKPVYKTLGESSHFKILGTTRHTRLTEIASVKDALIDRVRDPKQFSDLLDL